MSQKMRIIDKVNFAKDRVEPPSTWKAYSSWLFNIFGDLTENPNASHEMLEQLYCDIRSRGFEESFLATITIGLPGELICQSDMDPEKYLCARIQDPIISTKTPFLIIGNVGVGKSTYLHHFFDISTKEMKIDHVVEGIIINFRDIGDYEETNKEQINDRISLGKLVRFIDQQINNHLKKYDEFKEPSFEKLKKIFNEEIKSDNFIFNRLKELGMADKAEVKLIDIITRLKKRIHTYNVARIRYLTKKYNKKFFLILDNVDHLIYNLQINIFQLSKSLIQDYNCPFILTCREYTFPMAYKHMELAAFQPRYIHLTEPKVECVINKRKNYVLNKIKKGLLKEVLATDAIAIEMALEEKRIRIDELDGILENILESFLTEKILDSLKKLSNTDTRNLLLLIMIALSSGYIYPEKRSAKYDKVRHYDFIRALILGNNIYFNPNTSRILNLFENENPYKEGNSLIRIRLLQAISTFGEYVATEELIKFMDSIGYSDVITSELIRKLVVADLIESPFDERLFEEFDTISVEFVRLTACGKYYKDSLIKEFRYIQEMQFATYVTKKFYDDIYKSYERDNRTSRFKSTEAFLEFIHVEEEMEKERILKKNFKEGIENYNKLGLVSTHLLG